MNTIGSTEAVKVPPHKPSLSPVLTDDDLRALGAIVAQWAIAETIMTSSLQLFQEHPSKFPIRSELRATQPFQDLCKRWNRTIRILCEGNQDQVDWGLFLSNRGKRLKVKRDQACHWPATRGDVELNSSITFTKLRAIPSWSQTDTTSFTLTTLEDLSRDISEWGGQVGIFMMVTMYEHFPMLPAGWEIQGGQETLIALSASSRRYRTTPEKW